MRSSMRSKKQEEEIYKQREEVEKLFVDSDLKGKYFNTGIGASVNYYFF